MHELTWAWECEVISAQWCRPRFCIASLAPISRVATLVHNRASHMLNIFLKFTDLVVSDDARQVSSSSHMLILYN